MANKQTGFIVVKKDWFNTPAVNDLLGGERSNSDGPAHLILAGDPDLSDHKGIWLHSFKTSFLHRKDRSPVMMSVLIPWGCVLSIGVLDDDDAESIIGFKPGSATTLIDEQGDVD
jgi:hypothetical protein